MTRRQAMLMVPLLVGCEVLDAPDRTRELEGRVNELSAEVSAMAGRPVGTGKHGAHEADQGAHAPHASDEPPGGGHARSDGAGAKPADGERPHGEPNAASDGHDAPAAGHKAEPTTAQPVSHQVAHWGYGRKDGPEHWGEMSPEWSTCGNGEQQSPIDIEAKAGDAPPITFHYQASRGTVVDNGHTLQVDLANGGDIEIDGHTYELVQFHVHTPSEHTIAGEQYPLEVHLVHKDAGGRLAVVGVLFDSGEDSKAYDGIWKKWPAQVGKPMALKRAFDPSELLPAVHSTFRYDGSLTTPPCTEGVLWNVMRRTKIAPRRLIDAFRDHHPDNARPVMPLGERTVS
ncbi:MAG: carbonic anhydrase family protein [Kofleriaceae bacterium]